MKKNFNKYGLSRYIEQNIQLKILQDAGFGCVICGLGIIEYEHIDPEFKDCLEHNPENMTLLCPTCHSKKTRGFLSIETILNAKKHPYFLTKGHSNEFIDLGKNYPQVIIAGSLFEHIEHVVVIKNTSFFRINQPINQNDTFTISACFFDDNSKPSLIIDNNQWIALNTNWDVEAVGGKIIIKNNSNSYNLIMNFNKPNTIDIEKLKMRVNNYIINCEHDEIKIQNLENNSSQTIIGLWSHDNNIGLYLE